MKLSDETVSHEETRQLAPCDESVEVAHIDEHIAGCYECQKRLRRRRSIFPRSLLSNAALAEHIAGCQRCQIGCHK